MSFNVSNVNNNINSAIVSGQFGLSQASNNITQHAQNLAQLSVSSGQSYDKQAFLSNAVETQLGAIKQILPTTTAGMTADLIGLSINSINAQASAKVLDTANESIGTILDILA